MKVQTDGTNMSNSNKENYENLALWLTVIAGICFSIAFVMPAWLFAINFACVYSATIRIICIDLKKDDAKWLDEQ